MGKVEIRDVAPLIQKLRNFLLGREHHLALRFEKDVATRSPPPPNLPEGVTHRLNNNYYCARDARREVKPPLTVTSPTLIGDKDKIKLCTPGKIHQWD